MRHRDTFEFAGIWPLASASVAVLAGFLFVGVAADFFEAVLEAGFGEKVGGQIGIVGAGLEEGLGGSAVVVGAPNLQRGLNAIEGVIVGVEGDIFVGQIV